MKRPASAAQSKTLAWAAVPVPEKPSSTAAENRTLRRACAVAAAAVRKNAPTAGLVFDESTKKMHVNQDNCVGCGRCLGACNFDAIIFDNNNANTLLNCPHGRIHQGCCGRTPELPHFPDRGCFPLNCDCHGENDVPILPNIGMFASFDPLALDQACVDACMAAQPMPGSQLAKHLGRSELPRPPRPLHQLHPGIRVEILPRSRREDRSGKPEL